MGAVVYRDLHSGSLYTEVGLGGVPCGQMQAQDDEQQAGGANRRTRHHHRCCYHGEGELEQKLLTSRLEQLHITILLHINSCAISLIFSNINCIMV